MSTEKDKMLDAVVKLINLTQDGKLKWRTIKPRQSLNRDNESVVDLVYTTDYKSKKLGLYENKYRVETPPSGSLSGSFGNIFGVTYPHWNSIVILEFIDSAGNNLWTFPDVQGLSDLLKTVRYQIAGINEFLDSLLNDNNN